MSSVNENVHCTEYPETASAVPTAKNTDDDSDVTENGEQLMMCIHRIKSLPVILSALQTTSQMYEKIKSFGFVTHCLFDISEKTARYALELLRSINSQIPLECTFHTIDLLACGVLDYIEAAIPGIKLPPNEMYTSSKEYICEVCQTVSNSIQQYPKNCITSFKKYLIETVNEVVFISTCIIELGQDWLQDVITSKCGQQQHQLTHAEYEMIIDAIRSCSDCLVQNRLSSSPTEFSSYASSSISSLSIEF